MSKQRPVRHPEAKTCLSLREDDSHFGPAARAVFGHAAYTFTHFVRGDDYKWIALACLHEAGVPPDVLRSVAAMVALDLGEDPR
jgi:hypothetical protein